MRNEKKEMVALILVLTIFSMHMLMSYIIPWYKDELK